MACYYPKQAYKRKATHHRTGKHLVVFQMPLDLLKGITVPCGNCIGCKMSRTRDWAIRCMHETKLHQDNAFLTLTYSDENLPPDSSLKKNTSKISLNAIVSILKKKILKSVISNVENTEKNLNDLTITQLSSDTTFQIKNYGK